MNRLKRKRWLLLALLLLLLAALGWVLWPNRALAKVRQMQKELADPAARNLSAEERRQKRLALRAAAAKLSAAQRAQLRAEARKRRLAAMHRYFALSAADRERYLDEQIQRAEQRRQAAAANGQGRGFGAGGRAGGGGAADASATGGTPTPGSRDERRQDRLDSTTPAERAEMTQFFRDLNARRQQLGLGGGGRGFGPR
jgi:hypothetical protein